MQVNTSISEVNSGTGVSVKELVVYRILLDHPVESSHYTGIQDYVYDWSAVTDAFNDSNTLVYDADTNSLTLLWNGTAYFTGTLTEVAYGDREAEDMAEILAGCDRCKAGKTAPAQGLFLEKVTYPPEWGIEWECG